MIHQEFGSYSTRKCSVCPLGDMRYVKVLLAIIKHAPLQPSVDIADPAVYPRSVSNAHRMLVQSPNID